MRDGAMVAVVMTVNVAWNDCRHVGVHWQVLFGFGFEVPVPSGLEISRLGNAYVLVMTGSCAWRVSVLGLFNPFGWRIPEHGEDDASR